MTTPDRKEHTIGFRVDRETDEILKKLAEHYRTTNKPLSISTLLTSLIYKDWTKVKKEKVDNNI